MDTLPLRHQEVLRATVHHYVDTIEPVSSKTLVQRFGLKASSATVRSAMLCLENKGLLEQPHTSSGRIPSPQGYRHYVDCLLPPPGSSVQLLEKELAHLTLRWALLDDFLGQLAKRLTDFTGLMSLITKPMRTKSSLQEVRLVQSGERLLIMIVQSSNQARLLNIRLPVEAANEIEGIEAWTKTQLSKSCDGNLDWSSLPSHLHLSGSILKEAIDSHSEAFSKPEADAVFSGISRLVAQPEFSNSSTFQPLLELIDNSPTNVLPINNQDLNGVWIGSEHPLRALNQCSVVQSSYRSTNDSIGQVALIGPMRMAYSTAIASTRAVANHLERVLR